MVIGPRFAWAHIPKTGGDMTARVFSLFPEVVTHIDPATAAAKHDPFFHRREVLDGRVLALTIRRLPEWTVSYHQHMATFGRSPDFRRAPVPPGDELAACAFGDAHLEQYMSNGVHRWFRQESLVEDLLAFVGELTTVDEDRRLRVAALGRINALDYDHDVSRWLDAGQIRELYDTNPLWAAVEEEVYAG